jgi:hypothetical protein
MSGGLFTNQLLRETGLKSIRSVLSGCSELMRGPISGIQGRSPSTRRAQAAAWLIEARIPWAIASSGRMETAAADLAALNVDPANATATGAITLQGPHHSAQKSTTTGISLCRMWVAMLYAEAGVGCP